MKGAHQLPPSTVPCTKPLSLDRPHRCQHCSAAFIQFCSLKIHTASVHGAKVQAVYPESSRPESSVGNHGDRTGDRNKGKARHTMGEPRQGVPVDDSLTFSDMESSDKEWSDSSDYESHKQKSKKADGLKAFGSASSGPAGCQPASEKTRVQQACPASASSAAPSSLARPHACPHCCAAFLQVSSWRIHVAAAHRDKLQAARLKSSRRDRALGNRGDRAGEEKKVEARRKVCDVCSKTFSLAANLERHKRLHTGHKPFICHTCGRAFTRRDHLAYHRTSHADQKPVSL